MRRVWRAVRSALGAARGEESAGSRTRRLDDTIEGVTAQLRATTAAASGPNPRIAKVLSLPVQEIVKGRNRLEIRKLANAAFNGEGVPKDAEKATHLWVAAGMQGDAESMYSLAMCLIKGHGLPAPDPARGRTILNELAKQGHGWSAFSLSTLIGRDAAQAQASGDPTARRQLRRAFKLCLQAAELEVAPAFLNLYNMYQEGTGVARDPVSALHWLKRAAKSGDPQAQAVLALRVSKGDGVRKDEKLGFELYLSSAASGKPQSLYNVACAYFMGAPVPRDLEKAAYYFRQSADAGFYPAMVNLANMLQYGQGVTVDFDEAMRWYQEASKHTKDVLPAIEQLKVRMSEDHDHQLPAGVTNSAVSAFTETVSEVDGGRGVLYELQSPAADAPTLDVKLDVSGPEEAEEVMREIRDSGATTAAQVMEVLEARVERGAKMVKAAITDAQGNVIAEHGKPVGDASGDGGAGTPRGASDGASDGAGSGGGASAGAGAGAGAGGGSKQNKGKAGKRRGRGGDTGRVRAAAARHSGAGSGRSRGDGGESNSPP